MQNVPRNGRFLYSAVTQYPPARVMEFLEAEGCPLKTERGNRVFPVSDSSASVQEALERAMYRAGVTVRQGRVTEICTKEGQISGVTAGGQTYGARQVILATGGLSYASTGSTGDGYRFAEKLGHKITELSPALVPMNVKEEDCKRLQGLSLKNVRVSLSAGKKCFYEDFGEMMFTHFGVTGPLILSASSQIPKKFRGQELTLSIDLKPALTPEQLDDRLLRDFSREKNKQFKNVLGGLFPSKLIPIMVERSGIEPEKQVNAIEKAERLQFVEKIKNFRLTVTGLRDYNEAIITRGGICVKEVNPSTMESKLVSGLFFAGEVLDLDALTGGFNLQIAWSTAYAAGKGV